MITFDDFQKIELKIGKIMSAERVEGSEKLLKLSVDFAEGTARQVISGIAKQFADPAVLVGQKYTFITNLEPRKIMGLESQAMILAASAPSTAPSADMPAESTVVTTESLVLLKPSADIPEGTQIS